MENKFFCVDEVAQEWERKFQLRNFVDIDMSFEAFVELYTNDLKNRSKENIWLTKEQIICTRCSLILGR